LKDGASAEAQANGKRSAQSLALVGDSHVSNLTEEHTMPKGEQRSNKMVKKPKKDAGVPQEPSSTSTRPTPPITVVPPKGKLKNK
jgi:hypothetical protein